MKKFFQSIVGITALLGLLTLASCENYGKKVSIPNTNNEVYYKGDGVTEADAQAVGKFLQDQGYFVTDKQARSVQITKKNNRIEVRFVLNLQKVMDPANSSTFDNFFATAGALMSRDIFKNTPVDIFYDDDKMNDKKTIAYNPNALGNNNNNNNVVDNNNTNNNNNNNNNNNINPDNNNANNNNNVNNGVLDQLKNMQKKTYNSNTLYYGSNIDGEAADKVVNYLKDNNFYSASSVSYLILTRLPDNTAQFQFPIRASANNATYLQQVDDFVKKMKKDLFSDAPLRFEILDENMQHITEFRY